MERRGKKTELEEEGQEEEKNEMGKEEEVKKRKKKKKKRRRRRRNKGYIFKGLWSKERNQLNFFYINVFSHT